MLSLWKTHNLFVIHEREAAAFIQYIGDKTVTKTLVMEYKDELMEKYSKPSTINAKIIAINSYLKFTGQGIRRLLQRKRHTKGICFHRKERQAYYKQRCLPDDAEDS